MTLILDLNKGLIEEEIPNSNRVVLHDVNTIELKLSSEDDKSIIFNVRDVKSTAVISGGNNYSSVFWLVMSILVGLITWRLIDNQVWAWIFGAIIWILGIYFFIDKLVLNRNILLVFNLTDGKDCQVTLARKQLKDDVFSFVEAIQMRKSRISGKTSTNEQGNAIKHKNRYSNQVYTIGD
ncbi:MAG: hypothetical protein CL904_04215 [Dehalococcoidia bacterium]|nr:hypothetical protein [Dehalococcoidia bacterium]MQG15906.1 hypothetical protein [SAR202 cluster bacterium]|tara:strand:- start:884 stop:1423 length:540 start_codon:yes stop_codon:yes gene_type:complete